MFLQLRLFWFCCVFFLVHTLHPAAAEARGVSLTYGYSAGQRGALGLASGRGVWLHDAVVQQVPWPCIWECRALKLRRVHLMNETKNKEKRPL